MEKCWGPAPGPPGGHQQVLPNVLAGFERTEPVDGISQALVFAELRHEYERAGDVDVSNIDVPVLMRGEWLNETFTFARLFATWTVQRFT